MSGSRGREGQVPVITAPLWGLRASGPFPGFLRPAPLSGTVGGGGRAGDSGDSFSGSSLTGAFGCLCSLDLQCVEAGTSHDPALDFVLEVDGGQSLPDARVLCWWIRRVRDLESLLPLRGCALRNALGC